MIHEYAIDPKSMVSWASNRIACRYIRDNFGVGTPRIMANYPNLKIWRKLFREASASLDQLSKKRLEELFQVISAHRVLRSETEYDHTKAWIDNAEQEDKRHMFKAILAFEKRINNDHVLSCDQIDDWPDDLWKIPLSSVVKRDLNSMIDILRPLLWKCRDLVFVDPYFQASKLKFRDPLISFLSESVSCKVYAPKQRIEVHVSADYEKCPSSQLFEHDCRAMLTKHLPQGVSVNFFRWCQRQGHDKLHNRYILTDVGGVVFGIGLDTGREGESDDLSLLSRDQWEIRWKQYRNETIEFQLESKFVIFQ